MDDLEVARLSEKVLKRGSGKPRNPHEIRPSEYIEDVPIDRRKRSGKKGPLSLKDKIELVYQVVCNHTPTKLLAKKHRVTQSYVSLLVSRARRNPRFLLTLHEKE
jgi:hypothetical protein